MKLIVRIMLVLFALDLYFLHKINDFQMIIIWISLLIDETIMNFYDDYKKVNNL